MTFSAYGPARKLYFEARFAPLHAFFDEASAVTGESLSLVVSDGGYAFVMANIMGNPDPRLHKAWAALLFWLSHVSYCGKIPPAMPEELFALSGDLAFVAEEA